MNKVDSYQLFSILLLSGAWSVICMPQAMSLAGAAAAFGLLLVLCLPVRLLSVRGFDVPELARRQKWLGLLYAGYFLLWGAHGFHQLHAASARQLIPMPSVGIVLLLAVCLYTSTSGLKAAARCAPLTLAVLVLSVIVLIIGAWKRADFTRLQINDRPLPESMAAVLALCGELPAVWVLGEAKPGRAVNAYLLAKLGFLGLVLVLIMTAAGRLAGDYPFYMLTALSQPLQEQRADALYILVFVMLYVMHMTMLTGVTAHLLHETFPRLRGTAPFSLVAMLLLSQILPEEGLTGFCRAAMPLLVCGVPLAVWLVRGLRRRAEA